MQTNDSKPKIPWAQVGELFVTLMIMVAVVVGAAVIGVTDEPPLFVDVTVQVR